MQQLTSFIKCDIPKCRHYEIFITLTKQRQKNLPALFLHMFHRQSQQLLQSPQHLQGSCLSADHMPEQQGKRISNYHSPMLYMLSYTNPA